MSFRHTINGIEVAEPAEWKTFEQEIVRDLEKRTISIKYPGSSTFTRGGYRMLRDMFVSNDCGIVTYECTETCGNSTLLVVRANIILADCRWNLNRCEVECSLVDDGVDARISNNRGIPISPLADLSKNGVAITPVPQLPLNVFDPASGATLPDPRVTYDWLLCMQHAVQYMTDGAIALQSSWYSGLPGDQRWAITTGYQFRTADVTPEGTAIIYKFEELFLELAKKYNLWLTIRRDTSGNAVAYIEPEGDTFVDTEAASFEWTDNLIQSVDREQLWARVDVGSENGTKNQGNVEALPFLTLLGFSREEFHFETECNTDSVLDLVSKYTIDTNTLERMLGGDDGEDDSTVMFQYAISGIFTGQATPGFWFNPASPDPLYNEAILNKNVLERYALPSSVGLFTSPLLGNFRASATTQTPAVTYPNTAPFVVTYVAGPALVFNDDTTPPNTDPDGAWDVGTQRYTAPNGGFYQFGMVFRFAGGANGVFFPRVTANLFDASNVLITTAQQTGQPRQGSMSNWQDVFGFSFPMTATDYVTFTLEWGLVGLPVSNQTTLYVREGASVYTDFVAQGGGVTGNNLESRIITYEFDRITTAAKWKALTDNPALAVEVAPDTNLKMGHIKTAKRNIYRGTTTYTLLCKRSQK
jgi:hypothetical protein